jgi:bifunctional non-homologous end joining protein LigD
VPRKVAKKAAARAARAKTPPARRGPGSLPPLDAATAAIGTSAVRLTHPERVLFSDPVITKGELAQFYTGIARYILPGLINRPLMLLRCPDGVRGQCFFQKHLTPGFPAAVRQVADPKDAERWIYIDGLTGLMGLVQMSALEYHVWGSSVGDIDRADRVIFDLDPSAGVSWKAVIAAALEVRARLASLELQSFVRTSGGKGLHIVVPLRPAAPWDAAHGFARTLAESLAQEQPARYLAQVSKSERRGRIFIDYLRNTRGATAVCSYSLRNRPGAPIATPLTWQELPKVRAPDQYRYDNIKRRLTTLSADPWEVIDKLKQSLPDSSG